MIRRKLKNFFMNRNENRKILELLDKEELTAIERFLSVDDSDRDYKEYLASELMERTLYNIDPDFPIFRRLFETESDKLVSMEKGIVYMKEDYRGHYIHSVYNYLTGFFLFQETLLGDEFLQRLNLAYFDAHHKDRPLFDFPGIPGQDEKKEFQRRWALACFFHDLAYSSEINLKIMQEEGKRLVNFEQPYSLSVHDLQSFLTNPMMSRIKEKVRMSFAPDYLYCEDVLEILAHRMVNRLQAFSRELIYQSLRELLINGLKRGYFDHGLIGAVFLLQQFFSLIYRFFVQDSRKYPDLLNPEKYSINRNIIRFSDAMTAIALHNIKNFETGIFRPELKVKIANHRLPLAFLLILCDELQAWDREMEPPKNYNQTKNFKGLPDKWLDKNLFMSHFSSLYRKYTLPQADDDELIFYGPFWKDQEYETYTYEIIEDADREIKRVFIFKFETISLYLRSKFLENSSGGKRDDKIKEKTYKEMEESAWKLFIKNNQTLGQFTDLAKGFENFLSVCDILGADNKAYEVHKKIEEKIKDNDARVRALDCLTKDILPSLMLLKKGQDILFSYLKPYHFHDIDYGKGVDGKDESNPSGEKNGTSANENPAEKAEKKPGKLLLHYPGKEVEKVEEVVKKRLEGLEEGMSHGKKKETLLQYADPPGANLNRIINKIYLPRIEKYLYGIQEGKYFVKKMSGGKNGSDEKELKPKKASY